MTEPAPSAAPATPAATRPVPAIALWLAFLVVGTVTQIAFKIASRQVETLDLGLEWFSAATSTPAFGIAIACYIATFALWIAILTRTPLSKAFLLTALVYVTVTLGSAMWLGETVNALQAGGIALVIAGVSLLGIEGRRTGTGAEAAP